MAGQTLKSGESSPGILSRLRDPAPAGVYLFYTAYVSVFVALTAAGAFLAASFVADSAHAKYAPVFAGLFCGLTLIFARPDAKGRRIRTIAIVAGALLFFAGIGVAVSQAPLTARALAVPLAFVGFYVRRWPHPAQSAGMIGTIGYVVIQILTPLAGAATLTMAVPVALAGTALGYWFLPNRLFSRGLVVALRRVRSAIPGLLQGPLATAGDVRASTRRIDALLAAANDARMQADQYDPTETDRHLDLVHSAAVLARVWENAAESLHTALERDAPLPNAVKAAVRTAQAAIADALAGPSAEAFREAETALSALDTEIGTALEAVGSDEPGTFDSAIYAALNVELTLSHLLTASKALDEKLTVTPEPSP